MPEASWRPHLCLMPSPSWDRPLRRPCTPPSHLQPHPFLYLKKDTEVKPEDTRVGTPRAGRALAKPASGVPLTNLRDRRQHYPYRLEKGGLIISPHLFCHQKLQ